MKINEELLAARQAKGWSVYRLSQESGVQQIHIARIERGEMQPRVDTLQKLTQALQISIVIGN